MIEIKCDVCGGRGHLPSDCPNRKKEASVEEWRINSEYSKLISELSGRPQSENVSGPGSSSHPLAMKTIPTQAPPPPRPVRLNQPKQTQPPPPPPDGGMYIPASGFPPGWKPPP
jgi:hypothetical protein